MKERILNSNLKTNKRSNNLRNKILRSSYVITLCALIATNANAVPTEIAALKTIGDQVIPYLTWLVAMGGGSAFAINAWRVFQGQPKAAMGAMGGLLVSGIGFNGIFGEAATTLLI